MIFSCLQIEKINCLKKKKKLLVGLVILKHKCQNILFFYYTCKIEQVSVVYL